MQPAQLLQNLGVVRVSVQYALICIFGTVKVLLLFVDMTNLEPDVLFGQRRRWRIDNVLEALEACQRIHCLQCGPDVLRTSRLWPYFCCCLYIIPSLK